MAGRVYFLRFLAGTGLALALVGFRFKGFAAAFTLAFFAFGLTGFAFVRFAAEMVAFALATFALVFLLFTGLAFAFDVAFGFAGFLRLATLTRIGLAISGVGSGAGD